MRKTISIMTITMLLISTVMMLAPMASAAMTINLSSTTGNVGDEITVTGSGATAYSKVEIYWENLGGAKLGEGYANNAGDYEIDITIPEDTAGDHAVVARDVSTGSTAGADFTIEPKIVLDPTSGIPGDAISIEGTGFGPEQEITIELGVDVTPDSVTTDELGSFTAEFEVPDLAYADYTVSATDEDMNQAQAPFTVGASIILSPKEGPTGTVVTVNGRGFQGEEADVTFNGDLVIENVAISDGTFSKSFVVPMVPSVGTYTVTATDGTVDPATANFEVTGLPSITLDPNTGLADSTVTITGENFTAKAGTTVTVDFLGIVGTYTTNSEGEFSGTFTVPTVPPSMYTVVAEDDNGLTAETTYKVVLTFVGVSPTQGPAGKRIVVTGVGFTAGADFNVTIDGTLMVDGTGVITGDGSLPGGWFTVYVPTLPVGTYTITVMDETGVTGTTTFTVTDTTKVSVDPSSAPPSYMVDFEGNYFTGEAGTNVEVVLYNSTWDETVLSPTTNASGGFSDSFMIPSDLALGDYTINATDENGLTAETTISIIEPVYDIYPRADTYAPGESISFYINCSFPVPLYINITDSTGYTILEVESWYMDQWKQVGDWWIMPFSDQVYSSMSGLPDDALTGTYGWQAIDSGENKVVAAGTFTVEEKVTSSTILDKLTEMNATLTAINDGVATIETSTGTIEEDLSDLEASISSIEDSVATVETCAGEIEASLDDLDASISSLEDTIATVETSLGTIETDISNLGADVTDIVNGVATIETDLGTLTGTVEDIDGNVATIQTDLGTVQMDISDIKDSVQGLTGLSTPLWIAVALSLIAAIAAIAAVVSIYSKLA